MTIDDLIDGILEREGGFVNLAADRGGATHYGITAATLGAWRALGRPATTAEIKNLTADEARAIYRKQYVEPFLSVPFPAIQAQLVDISVNSGPLSAVKMLQGVLGVPGDGVLGDRTRTALVVMPWSLTNAALVAARVKQYVDLVNADASQSQFLFGWCRRAVSFLGA